MRSSQFTVWSAVFGALAASSAAACASASRKQSSHCSLPAARSQSLSGSSQVQQVVRLTLMAPLLRWRGPQPPPLAVSPPDAEWGIAAPQHRRVPLVVALRSRLGLRAVAGLNVPRLLLECAGDALRSRLPQGGRYDEVHMDRRAVHANAAALAGLAIADQPPAAY